ncbi:hypothetical protein [Mesorhizobium sp. M0701]|uniref:hypothetical protein n=1 Tax=unclassified Mesorhizobium TaxID=325217 RepID=UPI00333AE8EF
MAEHLPDTVGTDVISVSELTQKLFADVERAEKMDALKRTYRLQFMLNAEELAVLDAWRFENRLPNRAEAVRALLQRGLMAKDYDAEPSARSGDFRVLRRPDD